MSLLEAALRLKEGWVRFFDEAVKPPACIFCNHPRVWWNGRRIRTVTVLIDGQVVHVPGVPCRRVVCASGTCKSWALRPPGIAADRHYQLCVVAGALSEYLYGAGSTKAAIAQRYDCSRRTIGRWVAWAAGVADPALLQRRLLEALERPVLAPFREIADLVHKARTEAERQLLARSGEVLALFEALGVALGLEPPGLRGVVERTLANRSRVTTYRAPLIPEFAQRQASSA